MVEPCLDHCGPLLSHQAREPPDRADIRDASAHAERPDRHAKVPDSSTQGALVRQRDHDVLEPTAIAPIEQAVQHHFRPAPLQPGDDMRDANHG
jgi:hypothetical protein